MLPTFHRVSATVSIAEMKHYDQVEEESVYLAYTFRLWSLARGSQDRNSSMTNLEAEADSGAMARCCLLGCLAYLPIEPRTITTGTEPPMRGWALLH